MTKEDKELLLKDLCARLPYGVMVDYENHIYILNEIDPACKDIDYITVRIQDIDRLMCAKNVMIEHIKPYLRPMSSMTKEEKEDFYQNVLDMDIEDVRYENDGKLPLPYNQKDKFIWFENIYLDNAFAVIDWLNAHHFDFRNLIERGLAIDCTGLNVY